MPVAPTAPVCTRCTSTRSSRTASASHRSTSRSAAKAQGAKAGPGSRVRLRSARSAASVIPRYVSPRLARTAMWPTASSSSLRCSSARARATLLRGQWGRALSPHGHSACRSPEGPRRIPAFPKVSRWRGQEAGTAVDLGGRQRRRAPHGEYGGGGRWVRVLRPPRWPATSMAGDTAAEPGENTCSAASPEPSCPPSAASP